MGVFDKYVCDGQMDLFDFIEQDGRQFCWDDDINEIVSKLKELAESYGLEVGKAEFTVWNHVPHLGYRLWLDIRGTRAELFREDFQNDIGNIVDFAKSRSVELAPMWGACWFFTRDENEIGRLSLSTSFMDKVRQRRK